MRQMNPSAEFPCKLVKKHNLSCPFYVSCVNDFNKALVVKLSHAEVLKALQYSCKLPEIE